MSEKIMIYLPYLANNVIILSLSGTTFEGASASNELTEKI